MRERERQTDRQTNTERERQRERDRDRDRQTATDRQTNRVTEKENLHGQIFCIIYIRERERVVHLVQPAGVLRSTGRITNQRDGDV